MAQFSAGFSVTEERMVPESVHRAISEILQDMTEQGLVPDFSTLTIVKKPLSTGWTQMPTVQAFGVLMDPK